MIVQMIMHILHLSDEKRDATIFLMMNGMDETDGGTTLCLHQQDLWNISAGFRETEVRLNELKTGKSFTSI